MRTHACPWMYDACIQVGALRTRAHHALAAVLNAAEKEVEMCSEAAEVAEVARLAEVCM